MRQTPLAASFVAIFSCAFSFPACNTSPSEPTDKSTAAPANEDPASIVRRAFSSTGALDEDKEDAAADADDRQKIASKTEKSLELKIPETSGEPVEFDTAMGRVTMKLPASQGGAGRAEKIEAETTMFAAKGSHAYPVVQNLKNNTFRALTVISNESAPSSYDYSFAAPEGVTLEPEETGGYRLLLGDKVVGVVDPPWAVDADRKPVKTWYTVKDTLLTQHIEHGGAAYPVVADPKVSFGWYIYLRYSKSEVGSYAQLGGVSGAAALVGYLCSRVPVPVIEATCVVYVAAVSGAILRTFARAAKEHKCVELKFDYDGFIASWRRYRC
jgi:hypothetical protein